MPQKSYYSSQQYGFFMSILQNDISCHCPSQRNCFRKFHKNHQPHLVKSKIWRIVSAVAPPMWCVS